MTWILPGAAGKLRGLVRQGSTVPPLRLSWDLCLLGLVAGETSRWFTRCGYSLDSRSNIHFVILGFPEELFEVQSSGRVHSELSNSCHF